MKSHFTRLYVAGIMLTAPCLSAATFSRTLDVAPGQLRTQPVPDALFGANIGYWSAIHTPSLVADAQEAGLTVLRYHPGTYNDPFTIPGAVNMWDFTALDAVGSARLGDFGKFLIATGATGQIHINYGAGSPEQAAALVAYLRVPTDAAPALLNRSLGSAVVEPTVSGTRTRDWRTVGFWANLRASAPLAVDDGFNKLRLNHPMPFPIKYWECGNEADYSFVPCFRYKVPGETSITQGATSAQGHRADARNYAQFYAAAKTLMQEIDPTIQVGASAGYYEKANDDTNSAAVPYLFPAGGGTTKAWTPVMLTRLRELAVVPDFIIVHRYTEQTDFSYNNDYLLRGALRAYLATPAQGDLPRIHVTELNWSADESVPYTTTVNNAVNLARGFGDALQRDVNNLCWFTFTSNSAGYNSSSTTGWRKYHNWGIIADDPDGANLPGLFSGAKFPTFHAFALLKDFARPGDQVFQATSLSPENTNSDAVTVFASKRQNGDITLLVLNKDDANHTLNLSLSNATHLPASASGKRYGKAQDEEQRLKAIASPAVKTNNTREDFVQPLTGNSLSYAVPPLSVTVMTIPFSPPAPPTINSAPSATALQGRAFQYFITASPSASTFSATGLPTDLSLNSSTGEISGIASTVGEYSVELTATNTGGSSTATLVILVTAVSTNTLVAENFDAGNTAGWFAYSGDGGVSHTLTNAANGISNSPALNFNISVTAPPATYWYGGLGKEFSGTPPFTADTLSSRVVKLNGFVSPTPSGQISLIFKTPDNNGTLTHTLTLAGGTWHNLSVPLSEFANNNFDFAASTWQFLAIKENDGWPLASSSLRVDEFQVQSIVSSYTPLQIWRNTHFGTFAPIGLAADAAKPAGDGVSNLLKYAFNMIGTGTGQASSPTLPNVARVTSDGNAGLPRSSVSSDGKLQITYIRRKAATNPGISYFPEFSDTLTGWANNPAATETITSLDSSLERVTLTDSFTSSTHRFARVRISSF